MSTIIHGRNNVGVTLFDKVFLYSEWGWNRLMFQPRWGFEKWSGMHAYVLHLHRMLLAVHVFPRKGRA